MLVIPGHVRRLRGDGRAIVAAECDTWSMHRALTTLGKGGEVRLRAGASTMSPIGHCNFEIVIVDDDAMACASLSMLFTHEGYRVLTFGDGAGFLAAAQKRPPACVLLDVHVPGKSGIELLKDIDARRYPVPIVMMSGRGDIPTAVAAIKAGAYDFVEKQKADVLLI